MKIPTGKKLLQIVSAGVLAGSSLLGLAFPALASADQLTNVVVRFDDMKAGDFTSGEVCMTPSTTNASATLTQIKVTFPTGYTLSSTAGDWTTSTSIANAPSITGYTTTAWPSTPTYVSTNSQTVTFSFTGAAFSVSNLYCFNWTNNTTAVKQPASAAPSELGSVTTQIAGPTDEDTAQFATATLTNDTVTVTATVPPIFSFSVPTSSDALGTIASATLSHTTGTNPTLVVSTNAKNGWQIWAKDSNSGLKSTLANYTIPASSSTLSVPGEAYNTGILGTPTQAAGSGTITVTPAWADATATTYKGAGLTGTLQSVATSNGTADTATLTVINNIVIKPTTPAATDYKDVQTYVAAAMF